MLFEPRLIRAWVITLVIAVLIGGSYVAVSSAEQSAESIASKRPPETQDQASEARAHYARIMLLVRNLKNAEAGSEMLASIDHFEQALRGAGRRADQQTASVLREGRAGANHLIQNDGAVPVSVGIAVEALGAEIDRVAPRLGPTHSEAHMPMSQIQIPESMRVEHAEIHGELVRATKAPGRVGASARELAAILHPHFVREEEIALPPLGLLAPLARGEASPSMLEVLPMTDALRAELPRMLAEHGAIRAATLKLADVARAEGNTEVLRLTEKLRLHAQSEEELFYPAAVLVGDLVRTRSK